jgi:hypothetical protein
VSGYHKFEMEKSNGERENGRREGGSWEGDPGPCTKAGWAVKDCFHSIKKKMYTNCMDCKKHIGFLQSG